MAPAWVLLDRFVDVCFEDGNDEAAAAEKQKGVAPHPQSVIELLGSMKPDPDVLLLPAHPRIATFRLVGSTKCHEDLGGLASASLVACADKSIVVLYGGRYSGPGSAHGCYLVFAAAAGTSRLLDTVPRLPLAEDLTGIGDGAVVLRRHPPRADAAAASSSYLLAEVAATPRLDLPDAELYLCWSDAPTPQWAKKVVRLPRQVSFDPEKKKQNFNANKLWINAWGRSNPSNHVAEKFFAYFCCDRHVMMLLGE